MCKEEFRLPQSPLVRGSESFLIRFDDEPEIPRPYEEIFEPRNIFAVNEQAVPEETEESEDEAVEDDTMALLVESAVQAEVETLDEKFTALECGTAGIKRRGDAPAGHYVMIRGLSDYTNVVILVAFMILTLIFLIIVLEIRYQRALETLDN